MPVETTWHTGKRVIYQRFYGMITLEDFENSVQQTGEALKEGIAPVHVIADLREIEKYPSLIQLSKSARGVSYNDLGWTVMVTNAPVIRFIATVVTQLTINTYHSTNSMEKAVDFLIEHDASLMSQ